MLAPSGPGAGRPARGALFDARTGAVLAYPPAMRSVVLCTVAVAATALAGLPGCVERKLVIRSDPPGAIVSLEDQALPGRTPIEIPFEWDGVRRVTLQAEGHRVLETTADIESRWYDWFPLDAFAQFLYPGTIRDVRVFDYRLEPYVPVEQHTTREQAAELDERMAALKERADSYRTGGSAGPGGTAPPAQPESRAPSASSTWSPKRAEREPPTPLPESIPKPVLPGVKPPAPVPPPPLFQQDAAK
jgi:hypothetical protein